MSLRLSTEFGPFTWHSEPRDCPHENDDACPTCDHDGYYQTYVDKAICPKRGTVSGLHSWEFDGDDPYVVCHFCGEMRDALTGRVVREPAS